MIDRLKLTPITRSRALLVAAVLIICWLATEAQAQQTSDEIIRVTSTLVNLNIGVVDHQGHPVTTLSSNDFVVYEDGVRQSIQHFEPTVAPFSLVLMLDMSGSTLHFRQTLKQAAWRFIDALAPSDRVLVVVFNEKAKALTDFTSDRRKIASAIDVADIRISEGRHETQLYKALSFSLQQLAREKGRKAIVVMTDGLDTQMRNFDRAAAANAQTTEEAVASIKPEASPLLNAVLSAADRQGVTIYPLALPSGDPKLLPLPDPKITAIYMGARARLQTLADRTGGRLNALNRLDDLGRLYAQIAAELRTLYSIAYQPSGERARDGRWRAIRIEVSQPDLIAVTRPGYYAR